VSSMNEVIYPPDETSIDLQLMQEKLNLAKKIVAWNGCKSVMVPLIRSLAELGVETDFTNELNVRFTGDKQKLVLVMRAVRIAGFQFDATDRPKKGETSWNTWCNHPNTTVRVWFAFSSSVCRQVDTGKKRTIEVPIYEVQCGEDISEEATLVQGETPLIDGDRVDATGGSGEEPERLSDQF
jgi:hypothetical protein